MLLLIAGTAALAIVWFAVGRLWLASMTRSRDLDPTSIEWTMLVGAFVMAVVVAAVHFVLPLPSMASAGAAALTFGVIAWLRRHDLRWLLDQTSAVVRRHPGATAMFMVMAATVALAAARPCKIEDTENYHAQILRWAESTPLVPGLALVHGRLGFNSLWFSLEAALSLAFLSNGPLPLVNTATFTIGALYLFRQALSVSSPRLLSNLATAALVPYSVTGFLYAGSQSPDLPASTYGLLTFFAACQAIALKKREHYFVAMILAVASVCWKLSALPLLLFVPFLAWDYFFLAGRRFDRSWMSTVAFLATAGVVLIARSVVLSGYPFFPSTMIDVFPVTWKAPSLAHGQEIGIRAFARGFRTENPIIALTYPMRQWVPIWIGNWNNTARICLSLLALGAFLFVVSLLFRSTRRWFVEGNRIALIQMLVVSISGALFWFWQAPDIRFGASYLTALIALVYLPWLSLLDELPKPRTIARVAAVAVAVGVVGENLLFASPVPPWCSPDYAQAHPGRFHWLMPAPYPTATFVDERLRDGSINHVVASGGLAHYGAVPNSPLPIAGIAVHRGPRLSDGYRLDPGQ